MKKILAITALILYLSATSGVVFNTHFCCGELKSFALFNEAQKCCKNCKHCEDKTFTIQIDDSHFAAQCLPDFTLQWSIALWAANDILIPASPVFLLPHFLEYSPPLLIRNIPLIICSFLN